MHWKRIPLALMILTMVLFAAGFGCGDDDDDEGSEAAGQLRIYMVDAPALYDSVLIDVQSVSVHVAGSGEDEGWYTVNDTAHVYDLLQLQHGLHAVIGEEMLEPGHYTQIRLMLGEGNRVVVDGESFDLEVPSGQQSGLKLNHEFEIEPETLYELTLDLDASRSIHQTGNGQYMLRPTIRVIANEVSGEIAGTVVPNQINTYVYAIMDSDSVTAYTNDATGEFVLAALPEGSWDVYFDPIDDTYMDASREDVEVVPGERTELGEITLEHVD